LGHLVLTAALAAALPYGGLYFACRHSRLRWTWAPLITAPLIATTTLIAADHVAALAGSMLASVLATANLLDAERRDERLGGAARRRVRAKRGPLELLHTRRERSRLASGPLGALDLSPPSRKLHLPRTPIHTPRIALGTDTVTGRAVWLALDQLRKHTLILGATGSST
jgi:hypothetical protein